MSNDVAVYDVTPLPDMVRKPEAVLAEAKEAAKSLVEVVRQAHLARKFGGDKEHLFYEAWQTVGKFYGITAKVISSNYVEFGSAQGFEARAVAITRDGVEISAAESMCLSDEANWAKKPLFQLKSMAQTRACSKALRNVLAWVVVLAGFSPTPAEEMTGQEHNTNGQGTVQKPATKEPQRKVTPATEENRMKLDQELSDYCRFPDSDEVDQDLYQTVLKEISKFESSTKGEVFIDDVTADRSPQGQTISDKWIGSSLGKLREKVKADANKPE
jgi:hypothetical protein